MSDPPAKEFSGVETPVPGRMKLRELLSLARERLGDRAADLKTRDELEAALFGSSAVTPTPSPPEQPVVRIIVTKDFFVTPT